MIIGGLLPSCARYDARLCLSVKGVPVGVVGVLLFGMLTKGDLRLLGQAEFLIKR